MIQPGARNATYFRKIRGGQTDRRTDWTASDLSLRLLFTANFYVFVVMLFLEANGRITELFIDASAPAQTRCDRRRLM